jgi:hypothetical protein
MYLISKLVLFYFRYYLERFFYSKFHHISFINFQYFLDFLNFKMNIYYFQLKNNYILLIVFRTFPIPLIIFIFENRSGRLDLIVRLIIYNYQVFFIYLFFIIQIYFILVVDLLYLINFEHQKGYFQFFHVIHLKYFIIL